VSGRRRLGIFGGSFDPVHRGHVALAHAARDQLDLDELRWIPVGIAWQKSQHFEDGPDREAMVRLAIAAEPRFVLDRTELKRRGPSFTLDTVREKLAELPDADWTLVLGADQYAGLHTWRDWRELVSLVTLAIAARPGLSAAPDPQVAQLARTVAIALPEMDISSSDVRRRIAAGAPTDDLVPVAVARYIEQRGLYRADIRS